MFKGVWKRCRLVLVTSAAVIRLQGQARTCARQFAMQCAAFFSFACVERHLFLLYGSLDDIEAMDLHSRYTELCKAYEAVIQARNDDRKAFEQQANC